jgi:hypothetical protein
MTPKGSMTLVALTYDSCKKLLQICETRYFRGALVVV